MARYQKQSKHVSKLLSAIFILALTVLCGGHPLFAQDSETETNQAPTEADQKPAPTRDRASLYDIRSKIGGSIATSWMGVEPSSKNTNPGQTNRGATQEEGFIGEFAIFGTFSMPEAEGIASRVKVNVRACYSCHGLELETAVLTFGVTEHVTLRAGRFGLPVGGINGRHDQTTRIAVSKPLPQIMGGMVRGREFNQGVVPAPLVDNGIGITGQFEAGVAQFTFDFFATSGLKASGTSDISFIQSRDFEDNNAEPAVGIRLALDLDWMSIGSTGIAGNSDSGGRNTYQILTVDIGMDFGDLRFDFFYAQRRTEFDIAGGGESHFWKRGYWAQLSYPLTDDVRIAIAGDGLFVSDITLGAFGPTAFPGAVTDRSNQLNRASAGLAWTLGSGIQAKGGIEYWDFSDFKDAVAYQVALAWAF